jgi:quinol monooxygenase YgiN
MVTENAFVLIREGEEEAFEKAMRETGIPSLAKCPGVRSARLARGVENPSKFFFIVEWDSIEAHDAARASEAFSAFGQAGLPFYGLGGGMDHMVFVI